MNFPTKKAGIPATVENAVQGLQGHHHGTQFKAVLWTQSPERVSCVMSTAITAVLWVCGTDTAETDFS